MLQVAFYRNGTTWLDEIIRRATRSPYSHCEIVFSDGMWASSSYDQRGVYLRAYDPTDNWDYLPVALNPYAERHAREVASALVGARYDYLGALRLMLPLGYNSQYRWFCSEICGFLLSSSGLQLLHGTGSYSPGSLYAEVRNRFVDR